MRKLKPNHTLSLSPRHNATYFFKQNKNNKKGMQTYFLEAKKDR